MILPVVAAACTFILPHQVWFVKLESCDLFHYLAVSSAVDFGAGASIYGYQSFSLENLFSLSILFILPPVVGGVKSTQCGLDHIFGAWYLTHYRVFVYLTALFFAADPSIHVWVGGVNPT